MLTSSKSKPSTTEEERAAARALFLALTPFRDLNPAMPLSHITAYLLVAMEEGKGVNDYAERINSSGSVMTRNLLDIGERNRQRGEGYGWIVQERDLFDLRKHNARLTAKGKALIHTIMTSLQKA